MTIQLLPDNFDQLLDNAIQYFWVSRSSGSGTQGGSRGNVIGGKNLDGFLAVVRGIAQHCGLPSSSIFTTGRSNLTLPGYFRPTKNWDVVIVHGTRLLAVLEFKSQVGSFGNNFNNRSEEAIGNAADFDTARTQGVYNPSRHVDYDGTAVADPRPPFIGYLMLLEEHPKSTSPTKTLSPHFSVLPDLEGASYAERYKVLCERLVEQGLYDAAALALSPRPSTGEAAAWRALSEATSIRTLFTALAAQLAAAVA